MKQLGVNINRTNRCTGRLDDADFKPYLKSVLNLREHDHTSAYRNGRDALLFMLFSGVRRTGTMTVRMEGVDLDRLVFKIIKKGGDQVELPLNKVTAAISRLFLPLTEGSYNEWVEQCVNRMARIFRYNSNNE